MFKNSTIVHQGDFDLLTCQPIDGNLQKFRYINKQLCLTDTTMLKQSQKLIRTEIKESQRWGAGGPSRCFERPRDNGRERRRYHLQVSFKHTLIPQNLFFTRTQWVRRGGGASLLKFWMNKESCTSPSSRSCRESGDGQETQRRPCKLTDGRGTDPHATACCTFRVSSNVDGRQKDFQTGTAFHLNRNEQQIHFYSFHLAN